MLLRKNSKYAPKYVTVFLTPNDPYGERILAGGCLEQQVF